MVLNLGVKKLTDLYEYEFQTGSRVKNEHFEDNFYQKQLQKYKENYVEPIDPNKIENDRLIDEILKKISPIKRNHNYNG